MGHPQEFGGQDMPHCCQEFSWHAPANETVLAQVARADYNVVIRCAPQELRDKFRRVRKVAIQGHQDFISVLMCPADAIAVRAANTQFPSPMNRVDAWIFSGESIDDLPRAIGGIVVKKQNIVFEAQRLDAPVECLDILRFVIGGNENQAPKADHDFPPSTAIMVRTISSNDTRGRQPVALRSFSEFPQKGLTASRPSRTPCRSTTCSRQFNPTAENAISTNSCTEWRMPVARTKSSGQPRRRIACMAST